MTTRRVLTGLILLGLVAGFGYWLGNVWEPAPAPGPGSGCRVDAGGRVGLEVEQMANAATITAVGVRLGMPDRGVEVALATALQESKLRNLPHLGTGNDHDSIGLFQQRPSQGWGSEQQLADQRYAAERFYLALRQVPGWQQLRLTEAAQRVQRSAYPEAYAQWERAARVLATALLGHRPGAISCTVPGDPPARGPQAAIALSDALVRDWGTRVRTRPETGPVGALRQSAGLTVAGEQAPALAVLAADPRTGWQYAHWLVAHAAKWGIRRVHFEELAWTAAGGGWSPAGERTAEVRAELATG